MDTYHYKYGNKGVASALVKWYGTKCIYNSELFAYIRSYPCLFACLALPYCLSLCIDYLSLYCHSVLNLLLIGSKSVTILILLIIFVNILNEIDIVGSNTGILIMIIRQQIDNIVNVLIYNNKNDNKRVIYSNCMEIYNNSPGIKHIISENI